MARLCIIAHSYQIHSPEASLGISHFKDILFDMQEYVKPHNIYQSSSSSLPRCIALCLALNASANPPAKLGVLRPLSPPPLLVILVPESRGAGGGAGLRPPAAGRLGGGAGG
jgi:hypothetical protein